MTMECDHESGLDLRLGQIPLTFVVYVACYACVGRVLNYISGADGYVTVIYRDSVIGQTYTQLGYDTFLAPTRIGTLINERTWPSACHLCVVCVCVRVLTDHLTSCSVIGYGEDILYNDVSIIPSGGRMMRSVFLGVCVGLARVHPIKLAGRIVLTW